MGIFNVYGYNDTFISKYLSNENYSYKSYLCAGETLRNNVYSDLLISFLNFDIYKKYDYLDIVSARLYLHLDSDSIDDYESGINIGLYEILQPYNAKTVTWVCAPEIKITKYSINNLTITENGYISIDITELIQGIDKSKKPVYGIALVGRVPRKTVRFTSSRGENKPYIKIETVDESSSSIGIIGITEPIEVKGATGATGPIGPTGPQGPPGGPRGPRGVEGPIGPQGEQGIPGPIGPIGLQGVRGLQGPEGAQGQQGPPGPIGPMGPMGPEGSIGPIGAQGPIGPQGIQGVTGEVGPIGLIGPQGPQGPIGSQGPQGVEGATGPEGAIGMKGEIGKSITGPTGPTGPMGIQGITGPPGISIRGETGATGPQGITGTTGSRGATGQQGIQGRRGEQGIQGVKGDVGERGITPIIPTSNNAQLVNGGEEILSNEENIKLIPVVINGTDINEFEDGVQLFGNHTYYVSWRISSSLLDIHQRFGGQLILNGVSVLGSLNIVGPTFYPGNILTASATTIFTVEDDTSTLNLQCLTINPEGSFSKVNYSSLNIIELS